MWRGWGTISNSYTIDELQSVFYLCFLLFYIWNFNEIRNCSSLLDCIWIPLLIHARVPWNSMAWLRAIHGYSFDIMISPREDIFAKWETMRRKWIETKIKQQIESVCLGWEHDIIYTERLSHRWVDAAIQQNLLLLRKHRQWEFFLTHAGTRSGHFPSR